MFEIIASDNSILERFKAITPAMAWLIAKAKEYNDGYVTWFARPNEEPDTIIMMSIAGIYYKLRKAGYMVEIDGKTTSYAAASLAEVTNAIRGRGKRIRVWSPAGIEMIDTAFGDEYNLINKS